MLLNRGCSYVIPERNRRIYRLAQLIAFTSFGYGMCVIQTLRLNRGDSEDKYKRSEDRACKWRTRFEEALVAELTEKRR